jgi:hypothetical protein
MFKDLDKTMNMAGRYGGIIPREASERADKFSTSLTNLKTSLGWFSKMVKDLSVKYLQPVIDRISEWIADNRELISTRIAEFIVKVAGGVQWFINKLPDFIKTVKDFGRFLKREILPILYWMIDKLPGLAKIIRDLAPAIITVGIALKGWEIAGRVIPMLTGFVGGFTKAIGGATTATGALNALWLANPIGLIVAGVIILLSGAALLVKKISGDILSWGDSFLVVGQTLSRFIGLFLNPIYDLLQEILTLPRFLGNQTSQHIYDEMQKFQDWVNTQTTGSTHYGLENMGESYNMAMERARRAVGTSSGTTDVLAGTTDSMTEMQQFLEEWFKTFDKDNKGITTAIDGLGGGMDINTTAPALKFQGSGKMDLFGTVLQGI